MIYTEFLDDLFWPTAYPVFHHPKWEEL